VLHLHPKVEASRGTLCGATARAAAGNLADKAGDEGLYDTLVDFGQLYRLMCKHDNELQVYQEALQEMRGDIAHASTRQLQGQLSRILTAMGQMYISQYKSQITNGAKEGKGKCASAKALLEEALSIQRALPQYGMAADILQILASAHGYLEMFDEARSTLKQALDVGLLRRDKMMRPQWRSCLLGCRRAMAREAARACCSRRCSKACASLAFSTSWSRLVLR